MGAYDVFPSGAASSGDLPRYTYANRRVYRQDRPIVTLVAHDVSVTEAHDRLYATHGHGYRLDVMPGGTTA